MMLTAIFAVSNEKRKQSVASDLNDEKFVKFLAGAVKIIGDGHIQRFNEDSANKAAIVNPDIDSSLAHNISEDGTLHAELTLSLTQYAKDLFAQEANAVAAFSDELAEELRVGLNLERGDVDVQVKISTPDLTAATPR